MKSIKDFLREFAEPKSEDEINFKAKHEIEMQDHPESEEGQHTATSKKKARRADYVDDEDEIVYEDAGELAKLEKEYEKLQKIMDRVTDRGGNVKNTDAYNKSRSIYQKIRKLRESLDESIKFNGRTFKDYKTFSSDNEANKFLEKNDEYGVIGEKGGKVYVAKNSDKGIREATTLDPVDKGEVKKSFRNRKDKDIDNDGDVDDSDEYLHKRRKAVSKAIRSKLKESAFGLNESTDKKTIEKYVAQTGKWLSPNSVDKKISSALGGIGSTKKVNAVMYHKYGKEVIGLVLSTSLTPKKVSELLGVNNTDVRKISPGKNFVFVDVPLKRILRDLNESLNEAKKDAGFVGTSDGKSWAVKINGIKGDNQPRNMGWQMDNRDVIKDFKSSAKKTYAGAKGKATLPAVKKQLKLVDADQYFASWKSDSTSYKDDSVEIWYKTSVNESLDEAKMTDKEVLSAAKTLAKNGKDEKAKEFGNGLVKYYNDNGSFTPAQVGGLQNIMKNASFQLAKEDLDESAGEFISKAAAAKRKEKKKFEIGGEKYPVTIKKDIAKKVTESSVQSDLDPNKKIIVKGVKGMKSTPFTKKFRNMAAYDKWSDSDAADDFEIRQVMNEQSELSELSRKTLGSYHKKAMTQMNPLSLKKGKRTPEEENTIKKRRMGGSRAMQRISSIDKSSALTHHSYKGGKNVRKTNESVENLEENFKQGSLKLKDGSTVNVKKQDADLLNQMFNDLNSQNRKEMTKVAMADKSGFEEILGFAREAL